MLCNTVTTLPKLCQVLLLFCSRLSWAQLVCRCKDDGDVIQLFRLAIATFPEGYSIKVAEPILAYEKSCSLN